MASHLSQTPALNGTSHKHSGETLKRDTLVRSSAETRRDERSLEVERLAHELAQISRRLGYVVDAGAEPGHQAGRNQNDLQLSDRVAQAIMARQQRVKFFPAELFADPAWDMLINLFLSELLQRRTSVSNLCVASNVPPTTALRWIGILTEQGMFLRRPDPLDGRRVYVELTETALAALHSYFDSTSA